MPREQINHPDLGHKARMAALRKELNPDVPPSEFGVWNESSLHVGWHADNGYGWVQVGLEVDLEYARFAQSEPNGVRDDRTVMWTPVLTLAELDRAIAVLKRARRKAHRSETQHV